MKKEQGFSLVELSVVLVIISIIMGSVLSVATTKTYEAKIDETEKSLQTISQMLAVYVTENKHLPCPADPTLSQNTSAFGWAIADCTSNPGIIPTKTLQIADDYAFDGWGRRITYQVIPSCTDSTNFKINTVCANSGITVNSASPTPRTTGAAFVLVSHGPNGYGAWPHNGGATKISTTSAGADEIENADADLTYVQKSATTNFDDIVDYRTKPLLVKAAGGLTGMPLNVSPPPANTSPLCSTTTVRIFSNAQAIVLCGNGNTDCSNALWPASSTGLPNDPGLAVQIYNLCF